MNKINYSIPSSGTVTVKVVDIIGTPVKVILNDHPMAGNYEVNLDSEALTPGKYYYKVMFSVANGNGFNGEDDKVETLITGQVKIEV